MTFEIDKSAHKAAQKKTKMRNLARGNENPNEKTAAEKKAGGPKLAFEGFMKKASDAMKRVIKNKEDKKPEKAMDAGARARRRLKDKEHNKYVNFLHADD